MTANQVWALIGGAAAAVAALAGLYVAGAPGEERALRLDEQRVESLEYLVFSIDAYWQREQSLPRALDQLVTAQRSARLPVDPVSNDPYTYAPEGPETYRLCAQFARPSRKEADPGFWAHEAGTQCFELRVRVAP